ncbi:olfactory receptor 52B2-like [Emydura macquarii macquarii]|uniref:olfactory receptor 52B2-like n=1 Tax=Emydura macquarii macquarii TaxID=1129001 RepID=UPI003529FC04
MEAFNLTSSGPPTFILNGIPGLEAAHIWISIPFSIFYIISLLGNFMVLFVVAKEKTLHKPMYLLLCMLALTDIGMSTCVMPKALCIFWFGFKDITMDGCITQFFFIYMLFLTHSAILVTMAFDRYVAISVLLVLPFPLLLRRLPFCTNRIIPHTYCEHIAVVKMSCGDTRVNQTYGLVIAFVISGLDLTLIGLSYGMIIKAVLRINSKKANQKALNTCTAHISVILVNGIITLFSILTHRFGQGIAAHVHILLANLYLLVPPVLNPIIYGVKSKELRDKMGKYTYRM